MSVRNLILNPRQTNAFYVMFAIESGKHQVCHMETFLKRHDVDLKATQIRTALQMLRKQGVVRYDGMWTKVSAQQSHE
ncbi:hypothetical protein DZF79_05195 [Vibrio parahaemolyticus]|nr:hypothetical protein [Vibrio parahaemolyticus]